MLRNSPRSKRLAINCHPERRRASPMRSPTQSKDSYPATTTRITSAWMPNLGTPSPSIPCYGSHAKHFSAYIIVRTCVYDKMLPQEHFAHFPTMERRTQLALRVAEGFAGTRRPPYSSSSSASFARHTTNKRSVTLCTGPSECSCTRPSTIGARTLRGRGLSSSSAID